MTLDEVIESLKYDIEIDMYIRDIAPQLAEWLEQLKAYKQNTDICPMCDTYCSYLADEFKDGYNKAIDDFMEKIDDDICNDCSKCGNGCRLLELRQIEEQLKKEVEE